MLIKSVIWLQARLVLFFVLGGCFSFLGAMQRNDYSNADRSVRVLDQMMAMEKIDTKLKQLITDRDAIIKSAVPKTSHEDLYKKDPRYKLYCDQIAKLTNSGGFGALLSQDIESRFAKSISDLIDGRVKSTGERLVVPAWDAILDWIVKYWRKTTSVLFHHSKDPFTQRELSRWANIIKGDLDGLGILIRGREAFDSRSKDLNSRAFDSDVEVTVNQDQLFNEQTIKHYAEQCEYYAGEIERRKEYYKNKDDREVIFLADQIINWLLEFRKIILSIKSLKDVAAKFGSNIIVITEMQKNVTKLFEELTHAAIPSSSSDANKRTNFSDPQQRPSIPMPYGNYGEMDL